MKILFTGASSFTGLWFVRSLVEAGHSVTAVLRGSEESYQGVRKQRVNQLKALCQLHSNVTFGSDSFLDVISQSDSWDLFCHHAAEVSNYKSPDFDPIAALAQNTSNLKKVLEALLTRGCAKVLLTGTIFEQNEGAKGQDPAAFSPYGLSKGLTAEVFRHYTSLYGMKLGKFVVPNPFGPYEEERFSTYLARTWLSGQKAVVKTPAYVRDNIPVTLLAKAYAYFAQNLTTLPGFEVLQPSFYAQSNGDFTARLATALATRWDCPCPFDLLEQTDFSEPLMRINSDLLHPELYHWSENEAWDQLAHYYAHTYGQAKLTCIQL